MFKPEMIKFFQEVHKELVPIFTKNDYTRPLPKNSNMGSRWGEERKNSRCENLYE